MKTVRILYHLARADFFERARRYSFLVMLGLVLWLGYISASGQFRMTVGLDYAGVIDSAWVGATMTLATSFLLGLVGFYIVKGSVARDYATGVGQIMATTPMSRPLYMLGKWLSNYAVLGISIFIVALAGIGMDLWFGTGALEIVALVAPLVLIGLPWLGLVAALAVLFESVAWLRGGLGNILYLCLFVTLLIPMRFFIRSLHSVLTEYSERDIIVQPDSSRGRSQNDAVRRTKALCRGHQPLFRADGPTVHGRPRAGRAIDLGSAGSISQ